VVPVGELEALAAAVAERLLDPALAAQEGEALRVRAEHDLDIRDTTRRVAELYAKVLDTPLAGLEEPELATAG
jgi:hypothetical protein